MFWMRNKKNSFPIRTLIWRPEYILGTRTCDPSIYSMKHPAFIVSSFMENSIGQMQVNLFIETLWKLKGSIPKCLQLVSATLYATCDFQKCGILTSVDSDEPVQSPFKLRNSNWCSVSSLSVIKYSSVKQRL